MRTATHDHHDHHDGGFSQDILALERLALGRRRALGWLGLGAGALLTGCGGGDSSGSSATATGTATPTPTPTPAATATPTPTPSASASSGTCTAYASETEGPYPADGTNTSRGTTSNVLTVSGVQRSDIRSSFVGSTATADGVPLKLQIAFQDVNNGCAALAGYAIYLWHCSADGVYSLYGAPAESWLRGLQVTDANGLVEFTTIYPACYDGRWPHIHFEAFTSLTNATSGRYARLTSQFALPDAQNKEVFATSRYASSATNYARVSLSSDGVFGDNTSAQIAAMTMKVTGSVTDGYTATATVGIAT